MKFRVLFRKFAAFALVLTSFSAVFAQRSQAPKQEKLLNGVKLLMWSEPAADKVSLKVRIHSGSAFDPQGKEGVMAMLAEAFFPNQTARDFFKEDLGGGLVITSNYDYIQIDASARADEFLTMLEAVATAVANPTIDKETTAKLRAAQAARVAEMEKDASYVADRAVAKRLFGTFPYGRPELGTAESIQKIEFPDLLDAKQRFLTADNATVTLSGKIDAALAYRAVRRYFGSWLKADKLTPSTFKQPDDPDTKLASFSGEVNGDSQVRYALRGLARNDKDFAASQVLTFVLENRLKQNVTTNADKATVRHRTHILPGNFVFSLSSPANAEISSNLVTLLLSKAITNDEFAAAKTRVLSVLKEISIEDLWLNVDTYKVTSAADDLKAFDAVTLADVQRVAERVSKNPVVSVSVNASNKPASAN
jgi:predicted Zn-dependent peptidase